jgi:spore germination cell wall hydrolase CwlJ-like protein
MKDAVDVKQGSFSSNKPKLGKARNRCLLIETLFLTFIVSLPFAASAAEPDPLPNLDTSYLSPSWMNAKEMREKKAEEVIDIQSDRSPLTLEGKKEMIRYYADQYMPKKGCSLTEDLPADSNIHYVKPKPKRKLKHQSDSNIYYVKPNLKTKLKHQSIKPKRILKTLKLSSYHRKGDKIALSADERTWLEKLIEAEAGGEPYQGKLAVATVIANRVESPLFPNTVMEVIKANDGKRHQFSPWDDRRIYDVKPSPETKKAVSEVFDHGKRTLPADVMYFATTDVAFHDWMGKTRQYVTTIGNHAFFSEHPKS